MSNYQKRALKMKDYNLLAQAVACEYCGAHVGEPCRRSPRKKPDDHIKGTHYSRRALAAKLRREKSA